MTNEFMFNHIDHTQLKAFCCWSDIQTLCDEALTYGTASVCIPPSYVRQVKETYGEKLNICTVIGFPLGYNTTAVKTAEAKDAIENGASEIDMVINIGDVKNKNYQHIREEISTIRKVTEGCILKVIIETCFLTDEEKTELCRIITDTKADYIKTSTGFGTAGATLEDILLFQKHIGPDVKIKAAGGIKTVHDIETFLQNGCDRIGTSAGIKLITEETETR